ncbi:phage tail protein [Burkholderia cenocepacia]|uniref:phage tail protein n=1 Tax=Burkholderia cenocepacia TaxID=95486 RepID=UPI001B995D07|nr:phage tail protein [Burkholderia cenocepacia]MBR8100563.1 phage tail protein [Burkholderia cenocepacia]MDI9686130.1 phage tail protein [Burkholderia cenocepacia]HEP6428421.1 phage tail protein [Burkholderia cenocepacia]
MATQIIITDAGRAALVAAGNGGTNAHQVVEIGLANAPFVADKGLTKLPNELKRIKSFGGANVAPDTIHTTLKDDSTDQYSLYGFGLYLDNGVLLAAYGQATPIMEKSPAALLLLSSDMQFATIDATQLVFGDASFLNPPATTERQGVVELATQGEVDAGSDDTRAITPKTAASRYAALTGAKFTGPIVTEFDAGPDTAHVSIRPPSGKNGREGRVRLHGTFGGGNPDTGSRLVATIRSGFDNGAWGREYVDLWLNRTANDVQSDSYQARALRIGYGGRLLVGDVKNDDGNSRLQVDGNARTYGTSISGGPGSVTAWVAADETNGYFRTAGNASIGSENVDGSCDILAGGAARVRVLPSGRMLIGTSVDDGRNTIQAAGSATFKGAVTSREMDASGAHFRMIFGDYGALLRNDGTNVYFLSTKKGDLEGQWNDFRPFAWSLADGTVRINGNGATTYIGGELSVGMNNAEAHIRLGSADGYIYGNTESVGWWGGNTGSFQYFRGDRTFRVDGKSVWHAGNLPNPIQSTGFAMSSGAQILASEGTPSAPGISFINDGKPDTGLYHVNDGSFGVTCNSVPQISFTPGGTLFQTPVQGPTPAAGDRSKALATTEWVLAALSTAAVGQIVFEPRTLARAGFLKANGTLVNRADYPALWAYAQASGTLVSDDEWSKARWGCFSTGDGSTTFRLPELRGEFIRCWDDGRSIDKDRAIGSGQDSANRWHGHGASASEVGDHAHSAWTDAQGWHGHGVSDPGHSHGVNDPGHSHGTDVPHGGGGGNQRAVVGPFGVDGFYNTYGAGTGIWLSASGTGIGINGDGNHGHNVGIGGAGRHSHAITVNGDGSNEARPRNVALLAMIRAY